MKNKQPNKQTSELGSGWHSENITWAERKGGTGGAGEAQQAKG